MCRTRSGLGSALKAAIGCMALSLLPLGNAAHAANGQEYPNRAVQLIVPFGPGSTADVVARLFGRYASERLGQPVIVQNRSGAGGTIGVEAVTTAAPDGYTLLLTTSSTIVINPSLYKNLRYDVERDLQPIAELGVLPALLIAAPSLPANNVKELVNYVRQNPGKLSYASNGLGSYAHVLMELLKTSTGIEMVHIPYRGGNQADADLIAGNVHLMFNSLAAAAPQVAAGRLKALAVSSGQPSPLMPGVPGMGNSGVPELDDYDVSYWVGLFAPAGTQPAIVEKLVALANDWVAQSQTRQALSGQKILASPPKTPQAVRATIQSETRQWAEVLKNAKVEPQAY